MSRARSSAVQTLWSFLRMTAPTTTLPVLSGLAAQQTSYTRLLTADVMSHMNAPALAERAVVTAVCPMSAPITAPADELSVPLADTAVEPCETVLTLTMDAGGVSP